MQPMLSETSALECGKLTIRCSKVASRRPGDEPSAIVEITAIGLHWPIRCFCSTSSAKYCVNRDQPPRNGITTHLHESFILTLTIIIIIFYLQFSNPFHSSTHCTWWERKDGFVISERFDQWFQEIMTPSSAIKAFWKPSTWTTANANFRSYWRYVSCIIVLQDLVREICIKYTGTLTATRQ